MWILFWQPRCAASSLCFLACNIQMKKDSINNEMNQISINNEMNQIKSEMNMLLEIRPGDFKE